MSSFGATVAHPATSATTMTSIKNCIVFIKLKSSFWVMIGLVVVLPDLARTRHCCLGLRPLGILAGQHDSQLGVGFGPQQHRRGLFLLTFRGQPLDRKSTRLNSSH